MENFSQKLNPFSSQEIIVNEYQTEGSDPKQSFRKMLQSGARCEGLVVSGHHTGAFGGKRANGSLGIEFLEEMSCDPRYRDFFAGVKALWLQGCRTLGQKIRPVDHAHETPYNCTSADCHRERVGALLDEDHLTQSFADLEMEFSATLDQDNPLSSRYLRAFPQSTIFGWTKTSPGERSGSQLSLPYHIAHIARLVDGGDDYFQDPSGRLDEEVAAHYASVCTILFIEGR